ncbi:LADA_0D03730g1_1 [Lachancea dasiensis]|uniref:Elongator complex protein 4 n=1 Tax=Lachancea dasiensis TaxID=1072105 RepID=A0A1G4J549_9SACH|nr:LADA_0D03730g1_1 [Lachancea dasiensis]
MSFRKRGEVLGGPGANRVPTLGTAPGRLPYRRTPGADELGNMTDRMGGLSMREAHGQTDSTAATQAPQIDASHPGVRPSPATSQLTTSTGCQDLDKLLGHMGLPLGQTLLIQEQSATDFSSVLTKLFAAQGAVHNRADGSSAFSKGNTHLVALTLNQSFAKELPGVYQGSKKDVKRSKVSNTESKITVQNTLESATSSQIAPRDLKIAWRYGLNDKSKNVAPSNSDIDLENYPNYAHQFDITSRLVPAPTSAELTLISPTQPLPAVLTQLQSVFQKYPKKIIRIVLPNLLHPVMYPPSYSQLSEVISLLHGIRSIVKQNAERAVLMSTISTDLYSQTGGQVITTVENLFDSVIDLEPFPQEMSQFLSRVYKSQPNKIQHGLVHVLKLPLLSDRGEMHVMRSEYAFKNGKKKFEIEPWGIPIDDTEVQDSKSTPETLAEEHSHTRVSLDF